MLTKIITIAIFCYGAYTALQLILLHFTGNDLEYYYDRLKGFAKTLLKPVIGCVYCSPTFWGNLAYFALCYYGAWKFNAGEWLVVWVGSCGIIYLIEQIDAAINKFLLSENERKA